MASVLRGRSTGPRPCRLFLTVPDPFSLRETVLSHDWRHLSPFRWDAATSILWRVESFPSAAPRPFRIRRVERDRGFAPTAPDSLLGLGKEGS